MTFDSARNWGSRSVSNGPQPSTRATPVAGAGVPVFSVAARAFSQVLMAGLSAGSSALMWTTRVWLGSAS